MENNFKILPLYLVKSNSDGHNVRRVVFFLLHSEINIVQNTMHQCHLLCVKEGRVGCPIHYMLQPSQLTKVAFQLKLNTMHEHHVSKHVFKLKQHTDTLKQHTDTHILTNVGVFYFNLNGPFSVAFLID